MRRSALLSWTILLVECSFHLRWTRAQKSRSIPTLCCILTLLGCQEKSPHKPLTTHSETKSGRHATPRHATPRHATPRYRESFGRYYEYFTVGDVYKHRPGRTISETDNTWFTLLTMNTHPLHFDAAYAAESEFGRLLVNSCLTLSMVVGMSVSDLSQKAIANLGWDKIKLTAPVFIGDTIYSESQVLAKRESKSRPGQGIVTVLTTGTKADGSEFMHFERTFLVSKRGKA